MADQTEEPPPTEGFMYEVCQREGQVRILFMVSAAAVGLMVLWLAVAFWVSTLHPGRGSYVVAIGTMLVMGLFVILSGVLIRHCANRKMERRAAYQSARDP